MSGNTPPLPGPAARAPAWLHLQRTVRFADTDAAGVVQFQQLLRWCHEAYEESLERFGISAALIFPNPLAAAPPAVALPIVHCSADYRAPLTCGDVVAIELRPQRCDPGCFAVHYHLQCHGRTVATAVTRHRAIEASSRQRCPLPEVMDQWLEAAAATGFTTSDS